METLHRTCLAVALATAVVGAIACQKDLPSAPDNLGWGVVVYEHANYAGDSALISGDVNDFTEYNGPCVHDSYSATSSNLVYNWNDCISSIKVAQGWQATVFVDTRFRGGWVDVTADIPDLGKVSGPCHGDTWNDCISAIRVTRK